MSTHLGLEPLPPRPPAPPAQAPAQPAAPASEWLWRLGCVVAALLTLGVLLASFNPLFGFFLKDRGFDALRWPWELFERPIGGVLVAWVPTHVYAITLLLASLALLACSMMARSSGRTGLCVAAFVLVGVAVMPGASEYMLLSAVQVGLALLTAGTLARGRDVDLPAARKAQVVGCLLLVLFALLPYPNDEQLTFENPEIQQPYVSPVTATVRDLALVLGGHDEQVKLPGETLRSLTLSDWVGAHLVNLPLLLGVLVGLLALLGWGGRWAGPLLVLLLLVAALAPCVAHAVREAAAYREGTQDALETTEDLVSVYGRNAAEAYLLGLRAAALPLALAMTELLRRRATTD
ncbi:MAG: hypothetical protein ACKOSS_02420 [Planctomycetia bacterium]